MYRYNTTRMPQISYFTAMFKLSLSILLAIAEISVADECSNFDHSMFCRLKSNIPQKTPETEEELQKLCNAGINYFVCYLKRMKECGPMSSFNENFIVETKENLLGTLEVCNEYSTLHADVVENLKCFSEFDKEDHYGKCTSELDHVSNAPEKFYTQYSKFLIEEKLLSPPKNKSILSTRRWCFYYYHLIACYATKLEKQCGTKTMETYLTVIRKISYLGPHQIMLECEETQDLIPEIVSQYKSPKTKKEIEITPLHNCGQSPFIFCHEEEFPQKIPETKEELRGLCTIALDYFSCYSNYAKACYRPKFTSEIAAYFIELIWKQKRGVQEVCNESTPLYTTLLDNLECFRQFDKADYLGKCYAQIGPDEEDPKLYMPEEHYDQYAEVWLEKGKFIALRNRKSSRKIYEDLSFCLYNYQILACYAAKLEEECGKNAMDAYLTVIRKISYLGPKEIVLGCEETEHLIPEIIHRYKQQKKRRGNGRKL